MVGLARAGGAREMGAHEDAVAMRAHATQQEAAKGDRPIQVSMGFDGGKTPEGHESGFRSNG